MIQGLAPKDLKLILGQPETNQLLVKFSYEVNTYMKSTLDVKKSGEVSWVTRLARNGYNF